MRIRCQHKITFIGILMLLSLFLCCTASAAGVFAGGDGTAENPYQITTVEQLIAVNDDLDACYILMNDLDLSGIANWEPIGGQTGSFEGKFDGNGHIIFNVNLNISLPLKNNYDTYLSTGLFSTITNANISRLGVENALYTITTTTDGYPFVISVGGLAGGMWKSSIDQCYFSGDISIIIKNPRRYIYGYEFTSGGIVGKMSSSSTVTNSYTTGKISSNTTSDLMSYDIGGIVGSMQNKTTISKCYTATAISLERPKTQGIGPSYIGGICGFASTDPHLEIDVNNCLAILNQLYVSGENTHAYEIGYRIPYSDNTYYSSPDNTVIYNPLFYLKQLKWNLNSIWTMEPNSLPHLWAFDKKDTDKDGLLDQWELFGVDTDGNGSPDLDLLAMGADPTIPDIFIEVDWMFRPETTKYLGPIPFTVKEKSLQPSQEALQTVIDQFANHGIRLHIDAGSNFIMNPATGELWGARSKSDAIDYVDLFDLGKDNKKVVLNENNYENWYQLVLENFSQERYKIFRHCTIINKFDSEGTSGIACYIPSQFFILADLNGFLQDNRAFSGTFMHELGHTLGLMHGGDEDVNYKPNHLSIMNYYFQFKGLLGTNEINYSEYTLPAIDESNINESAGVDPEGETVGLGTKWFYGLPTLFEIPQQQDNIALAAIDFNKNNRNSDTGLQIDLNNDGKHTTILGASIKEWEHLVFKGGNIGGLGASTPFDSSYSFDDTGMSPTDELSYDEAKELGLLGNPDDCIIDSIVPGTLYEGIENQYLIVNIQNLFPQATNVELTVSSPLLAQAYRSNVSLNENEFVSLKLPIPATIQAGVFPVECRILCANGESTTLSTEITVFDNDPLTLTQNEAYPIESTILSEFTPVSSAPNMLDINNGKLTGLEVGQTFVELYDDSNTLIANIPINIIDSTSSQHILTEVPAKPSTCTEHGNIAYLYCEHCDHLFTDVITQTETTIDEVTLPLKPHSGGQANCVSSAVCSVCSTPYGEADPNHHTGETELRNQKEPTTTEPGYSGDTHCTGCQTLLVSGIEIPCIAAEATPVPDQTPPRTGDRMPISILLFAGATAVVVLSLMVSKQYRKQK